MWPGFGENMRVLDWIVRRCKEEVPATSSAIGYMPAREDLNLNGLDLEPDVINDLLDVDKPAWREEISQIHSYLQEYGTHLPAQILEELEKTGQALE